MRESKEIVPLLTAKGSETFSPCFMFFPLKTEYQGILLVFLNMRVWGNRPQFQYSKIMAE